MNKELNLSQINDNSLVVITKIEGLDLKIHKRLIELGFVLNTKIKIIKNNKKSKIMLVGLRGYVLSLDFFIASKIFVIGETE